MKYNVRIRQKDMYLCWVDDFRSYWNTATDKTTEMTVVSDSTDESEIYNLAYKQYAAQNGFPVTDLNDQHHGFNRDDEMQIRFPGDYISIELYVKILNKNTSPS